MSLIHRSLEQMRRKKAKNGGSLPKPAAAKRDRRSSRYRLALFTGLGVMLLGMLALGGAWYYRGQLGLPLPWEKQVAESGGQSLEELKARARSRHEQAPSATPAANATAPPKQATAQAQAPSGEQPPAQHQEARPLTADAAAVATQDNPAPRNSPLQSALEARRMQPQPAQQQTGSPAEAFAAMQAAPSLAGGAGATSHSKPLAATEGSSPETQQGAQAAGAPTMVSMTPQGADQALEQHFARQAQRNQQVIDLERELVLALRHNDEPRAEKLLKRFLDRVGHTSVAGLKWQGYYALQQKHYPMAEEAYRDALALAPKDLEASYNLLLALLQQDKREQARPLYLKLLAQHPSDERLEAFGELMRY